MRIPSLKPREVIYAFKKLGFEEKRQTGSHKIFYHPLTKKIIPLPIHSKDLKKGLLKSIIAEIGLKPQEFLKILRK